MPKARKQTKSGRRTVRRSKPKAGSELTALRNIGVTVARRLNEVGIHTRADLEDVGPVDAYLRILATNPGTTLPVCYYLYSLQGALIGCHWDKIPASLKQQLQSEVDKLQAQT